MHDQHFDEQIKTKLLMLQIPFKESEWELFRKRLEPPIDLLARAHLVHYEEEQMENDWDIFEEKLVNETISVNTNFFNTENTDLNDNQPSPAYDTYILDEFDQNLAQTLDPVIQNSLDDYEASYDQNDWELFSAQFHGAFDSSVQRRLEGYEATYNVSHWHHMSEQLNLPFYAAIKSKFSDYQVPFRRSDWWRMALRLRHTEFVDSPVLQRIPSSAYGVAAAILLLFALNIFTFLPRNQTISPILDAGIVSNDTDNNFDAELSITDIGSSNQTNTKQSAVEGNFASQDQKDNITQTNNLALTDNAVQTSLNTVVSDSYSPDIVANIRPREESIELNTMTEEVLVPYESSTSTPSPNTGSSYYASFASNRNTSEVRPISIEPENISIGNGISGFSKDQISQFYASRNQINPEIRIGVIGGFNSSVAELTTKGRAGHQVGLRLEMAFNEEWSVISGIVYNKKGYQHRYLSYGANTTQKLLDARFKTVEIPLLVRHTFPPYGKTSLYIQSGIVMMTSMEEFYLIFDPNSVANLGVETRTLSDLEPKNQLLNFHTYVGNVHTAMGLQYELTDNINLQLEPYFQLGLQRMGSEGKKLYSAGINFGAVYRIGNRDT